MNCASSSTPNAVDFHPPCTDFVTHGCVLQFLASKNLELAATFTGRAQQDVPVLLLELLFLLVSGNSFSQRVLVRLAQAESTEPDVWLRDDIRIAWITVLNCANHKPTPWEWAFNTVIGGHPSKVIPQLVERVRKHAEMDLAALPPKRPSVSADKQSTENIA